MRGLKPMAHPPICDVARNATHASASEGLRRRACRCSASDRPLDDLGQLLALLALADSPWPPLRAPVRQASRAFLALARSARGFMVADELIEPLCKARMRRAASPAWAP